MMPSWEPLLTDPALARRADAIVQRTARFFDAQAADAGPPRPARLQRFLDQLTGSDGVPAVALFFAYLALEGGRGDALAATSLWLDRAVDLTSRLEEPKPWLSTGVAGCAWVIAHVLPRLAAPRALFDDDPNEGIDASLAELMIEARGTLDAELTMGLAGLGTYYLEGLPRASSAAGLARVLEQLREQAEQVPNGFTWRKGLPTLSAEERRRHPEGLYNLGMPHGVPGVVAFLARVCEGEASSDVARELLEGAAGWLLDQKRPCGASLFPSIVDPRGEPAEAESRLGWCYGDLGIAAALLQAARALKRGDWEREALAIAAHAAARPEGGSGVEDGMICHGAAGVAHLFNRLYQASGRRELREAALRWYRATVEYDDPSSGQTGYRCLVRDPEDAPAGEAPIVNAESYGVTVGVTGVALALLAGLGRVPPDWDRAIGTAVRPIGRGQGADAR